MGREDSVERNLEKRVFSMNILVFSREIAMREKEMIPTHLDVSYIDIVQFTYFNDADDDAPYGLSDNFDDVDGLCDVVDGPLFSRFRTRTDVFGQVDGTQLFGRVVSRER